MIGIYAILAVLMCAGMAILLRWPRKWTIPGAALLALLLLAPDSLLPLQRYGVWILSFGAAILIGVALRSNDLARILPLMAVAGLGYAVFMPPFQMPDEYHHLQRTYLTSAGQCRVGPSYFMPLEWIRFAEGFPQSMDQWRRITGADLRAWFDKPAAEVPTREVHGAAAVLTYPCVPYLPQAIVMRAAQEAGASLMGAFLAARIAGLITYLALVSLAWYLLPYGRLVLLGVAMLPMTMQQGASMSADCVTIGFSFVYVAYLLRLRASGAALGRVEALLLAASAVFIGCLKPVFWLAAAPALVPSFRRRWLIAAASLLLAAGTSILWQRANAPAVQAFARHRLVERHVDVTSNVRTAMKQPATAVLAVARTMIWNLPDYSKQFVGRLAGANIQLDTEFVVIGLTMLVILATTDSGKFLPTPLERLLCIAIPATATAVTLILIFATEVPAAAVPNVLSGVNSIPGFQGRYLTPYALVFLLAFSTKKLTSPIWLQLGVLIVSSAATNVHALSLVQQTYYVEHRGIRLVPPQPDLSTDSPSTTEPAPLLGGPKWYAQTFLSNHDRLTRVEVLVATYGRTLERGAIELTVREDDEAGRIVATAILPASNVRDNKWVEFDFPPIVGSAGKRYRFELRAGSLPPETPITVWVGPSTLYPDGEFFVDGAPLDRDCIFRTYWAP